MRIERIRTETEVAQKKAVDLTLLDPLIAKYKGKKGNLIPLLQGTQDIFGYIPQDAFLKISEGTGLELSEMYGVATFYAQFRFTPRGKQHCMVCRGTACHVNGAPRILEELEEALGIKEGETTEDLEYSLETVACIGACSLAPAVMINDTVEAKLDPKKVRKLFKRDNSPEVSNA
jgi:NADH-quinone oxidoreductase subunit E